MDPSNRDGAFARRPLRVAVLWCEDAPKWQAHRGDLQRVLGGRDDTWTLFDATAGALPAAPEDFAALVVTGSRHSVHDGAPWIGELFRFLRAAADAEATRTVGICFGCQAIATALGGAVAANPVGRFVIGTEAIRWRVPASPPGARLDGLSGTTLRLIEAHAECVRRLPDGAVPLATSATAEHEAFVVPGRLLAVQAHPELSAGDVLRHIVPTLVEDGRLDEARAAATRRSLAEPNDAPRMLAAIRGFLEAR